MGTGSSITRRTCEGVGVDRVHRGLLLPLLALALLAVACRSARQSQTPTPQSTTAGEAARVLRVVDGDTILVELEGREERVRYIGVDAPESVAPDRPPGCFGREAREANRELVEGKTVRLERDVSERDRFGRLLRYVYADGASVNEELVRRGYATAVTFPPDVREAARFRALERQARESRRGLWGACGR